MKLSPDILSVLKNFSTINQNILIQPGNRLRTMAVSKTLLCEAEIEQSFPREVAIYDLNTFLNAISLIPDCEIEFEENSMKIYNDNRSIDYRYSNPSVIVSPPNKELKLPSEDVCLALKEKDLASLIKASSILQAPDISIVGKDGELYVEVCDKKNSGANSYTIDCGETVGDYRFNLKVEQLKMMPGNYNVVISKSLLARFVENNKKLTYFVSLEPDSYFNE